MANWRPVTSYCSRPVAVAASAAWSAWFVRFVMRWSRPCHPSFPSMCHSRSGGWVGLVRSLGHAVEPPVPSLFSLHVPTPWLRSLPGISVGDVELSVEKLRERGSLLITHNGISGPVVLRLSAWGARILHEKDYRFTLRVNWIPQMNEDKL